MSKDITGNGFICLSEETRNNTNRNFVIDYESDQFPLVNQNRITLTFLPLPFKTKLKFPLPRSFVDDKMIMF